MLSKSRIEHSCLHSTSKKTNMRLILAIFTVLLQSGARASTLFNTESKSFISLEKVFGTEPVCVGFGNSNGNSNSSNIDFHSL